MGFKKNIIFKQPKPLSHVIPVAAEGGGFILPIPEKQRRYPYRHTKSGQL